MKLIIELKRIFEDNEYLENLSSSLDDSGVLYRIYCTINNKSYIGVTDELYNRINNSLIGHKIKTDSYCTDLYNDIRSLGIQNFQFIIEEVGTFEYVDSLEESYISIYDSFYNGYNRNLNGKSGCLGLVCIINLDTGKMNKVKPNEAKKLVESGEYRLGGLKSKSKGRIYIFNSNTGERKMVYSHEVGLFVTLGFKVTRGFSPTKGLVSAINLKTGECIRVTPEEVELNPDLKRGRNYGSTKGKVRMTNGIINKFVNKDEDGFHKANGFWRGGITRKIYKNKGIKRI